MAIYLPVPDNALSPCHAKHVPSIMDSTFLILLHLPLSRPHLIINRKYSNTGIHINSFQMCIQSYINRYHRYIYETAQPENTFRHVG